MSALLATIVLVAVLVAVLYVVGERSCPPPGWAFWRFTDGGGGRVNFACVA